MQNNGKSLCKHSWLYKWNCHPKSNDVGHRYTVVLVFPDCTQMNRVEDSHNIIMVQIGLQLFKWGHFQIFSLSYNLTSDDLWPRYMTFDCMNIWRFTYYINNQVWFKSDFNFSNEAIFKFSAYLTTWPQMTFDLDIWPLTSPTNEGSQVASMTQLWLKSIKACER